MFKVKSFILIDELILNFFFISKFKIIEFISSSFTGNFIILNLFEKSLVSLSEIRTIIFSNLFKKSIFSLSNFFCISLSHHNSQN